jgi:beta-N-acetylhexosaminidase
MKTERAEQKSIPLALAIRRPKSLRNPVRRLVFLILLLGTSSALIGQPSFYDPLPDDRLADMLIDEMTDRELLGQVFFLGYLGTSPSPFIKDWIRERGLGGVKIFRRNVDDLTTLAAGVREMQDLALGHRLEIPLLVATDQEGGGWVQHVREGASITPGNMALGASGIPKDALDTGYYIGLELKALGINMNFAPTVDVYTNPGATVIGSRAFSSDPQQVGLMSVAYYRGLAKAGLISTAKHFPGHGSADKDSHGFLPEVVLTFDELWEKDLLPYRMLIRDGIPAIMDGHLAFPNIVEGGMPSSLSPFFLKELLRDRLRFQGVLITDDLEMYGVHQGRLDMASVSRQALEAGNDMILLSHTPVLQETTWAELYRVMGEDASFRARVVEAARRVLLMKLRWLKEGFPLLPDVESVAEPFASEEARDFFFNSSCRAVTVIEGEGIPYRPGSGEKILLVGQVGNFLSEGEHRFPTADVYEYPFYPMEWSRLLDRETVPRLAEGYDTVIFCLTSQNSLEVLNSLKGYEGKLYVLSTLSPVQLEEALWVRSALAVYGMGADSFRAGFAVLVGDFEAEGVLPIRELLPSLTEGQRE